MIEVLVRNNNNYLESIKCEDGEFHFVQPKSVATLSSTPLELPKGVALVKAPTPIKQKN